MLLRVLLSPSADRSSPQEEAPPSDGATPIPSSPSPPSPSAFIDVDSTMVAEADTEIRRNKMSLLRWYCHRSLPDGLHGSTLRVHETSDRLYLCGGAYEDGSPNKSVYCCSLKDYTRWTKIGVDAPQYYCGSAVINEELVLIGGLNSTNDRCTKFLSSYDTKTERWIQKLPPLPTPRSSAAAVVCDDYLVVVGGQNEDGEAVNVVQVLHIPMASWETAAGLPIRVAGQSVTICGTTVFLVGGSDGSVCLRSVFAASIENIISSCRRFAVFAGVDRAGKVWKQLSDSPYPLMVAVANRNQLLALGGTEETNAAENVPAQIIWMYEQGKNIWTPIQNMPSPHHLCSTVVLSDSTMLVIGGEPDFNQIDIAELL